MYIKIIINTNIQRGLEFIYNTVIEKLMWGPAPTHAKERLGNYPIPAWL